MKRLLLLVACVVAFAVEAKCSYIVPWDAEKDAYYLNLTFSYDYPNAPDITKTSHFIRGGTKWYHDRVIGTEDVRTAYGEWSFALEDGKSFDSVTVTISANASTKTNSVQYTYFSSDPTVNTKLWPSSTDPWAYIGDGTNSLIGYNSSNAQNTSYTKTFDDVDAATVYVLDWIRDLNDDNYTAINGIQITATAMPIPEPATMSLLGVGLLAVGIYRKRR